MDIKIFKTGSSGNCGKVNNLLVDAGIPVKSIKKALEFRLAAIAGVLITHRHKDHCLAVPDLIKCGIDCYMSEDVKKSLNLSGHRVHTIEPLKQFKIGSMVILPFDLIHYDDDGKTPCDNTGFLIKDNNTGDKLAWITDTAYCRYKFKGLTHIAVEANYSDEILSQNIKAGVLHASYKNRLLYSHFSLNNLLVFLKSNDLSKCRAIHLLHLSSRNADAKKFKHEVQSAIGLPVYICI